MSKLGELNFVFKGSSEAKDAFIVLHGYGADMHDLASLGQWLAPRVDAAWYFLQAPLEVAIGPYMKGRAWFPIDMMKLQMATAQNQFSKLFEDHLPEGIDESAHKVKEVIELVGQRHQSVHLAGFSQGSMMSAKLALENQNLISSLTMLSGVLVSKDIWQKHITGPVPFPTFQSHGVMDPVLPIQEARKLRDFLISINENHEYLEFQGGHEIPLPVLDGWLKFLKGVVA